MNISGKWRGVIIYGEEYGENAGKELYFEMEVAQTENRFTASAKDTSGWGLNPTLADIIGETSGREITFIKRYPALNIQSLPVDDSHSGPEIDYHGVYDESTGRISGTWVIKQHRLTVGYQVLIFPDSSGDWFMERA